MRLAVTATALAAAAGWLAAEATMPAVPAIDGKTSYMATPENFAGIVGGPAAAPKKGSTGSTLPPETHLAWLEYLANAYVQCDDFAHAREILNEMYVWLVEPPRLRTAVSTAIQMVQRRIDERHECLMTQHGPGGKCAGSKSSLGDKGVDGAAMAQVMARVQAIETAEVTETEKQQLAMVHKLLRAGFVNSAMQTFHQISQTARAAMLKEPFGKLEFVLKLVRFDLENPNNCMPLWRTVCCLDWRMKHHVLDAYDLMSGRAFHGAHTGAAPSLKQILSRLDDMPLASELKTRLLVADGRPQAWRHLDYLPAADQYLAQACLTLRSVPRPDAASSSQGMVRATVISAADQLDARARAKAILRKCVDDSKGAPTRCAEGLAELEGLQKSCPYGGFIRVGVFSQVFGDYLFIKCLSLPYTVPAGLPALRSLDDVVIEAKAEVAQQMRAEANGAGSGNGAAQQQSLAPLPNGKPADAAKAALPPNANPAQWLAMLQAYVQQHPAAQGQSGAPGTCSAGANGGVNIADALGELAKTLEAKAAAPAA